MDKEILKSSLFGYSKISVCQYIATMNEEFNAKLMAEADFFCEEYSKQQKKIDGLEAELAVHKQNACDVGTMLKMKRISFFLNLRQRGKLRPKSSRYTLGLLLRFGKIWRYWPTGQMMR